MACGFVLLESLQECKPFSFTGPRVNPKIFQTYSLDQLYTTQDLVSYTTHSLKCLNHTKFLPFGRNVKTRCHDLSYRNFLKVILQIEVNKHMELVTEKKDHCIREYWQYLEKARKKEKGFLNQNAHSDHTHRKNQVKVGWKWPVWGQTGLIFTENK